MFSCGMYLKMSNFPFKLVSFYIKLTHTVLTYLLILGYNMPHQQKPLRILQNSRRLTRLTKGITNYLDPVDDLVILKTMIAGNNHDNT